MKILDLCMRSPSKFMMKFLLSKEFTYCEVCSKPFKGCKLICKQHEKTVDEKEIQRYMEIMRNA